MEYLKIESVIHRLLDLLSKNTHAVTGFLPAKTPIKTLPDPFLEISNACDELAQKYHGIGMNCRPWLERLFSKKQSLWRAAVPQLRHEELEALVTQVSLLCHAYRWQSMPTASENYRLESIELPEGLKELWNLGAELLEIPRVGIFYTMVTNNWQLRHKPPGSAYHPNEISDASVDLLYSWLLAPEKEALRVFIVTALGMEAKGAVAIRQFQRILKAILHRNAQEATHGFLVLEGVLQKMLSFFNHQIKKSRIKPSDFLRYIQPTMVWLLDEGTGPLEGASGPQACTIQLLDSFFGVQRDSELGKKLLQSRNYMLPKHRELLAEVDKVPTLVSDFVTQSKNYRLTEVYNNCLLTLLSWRTSHQKRGAVYVQGDPNNKVENYVSTGLVVQPGQSQTSVFENAMAGHMQSTKNRVAPNEWAGKEKSFDYLFRFLDDEGRQILSDRMIRLHFAAGDFIIYENEWSPGLYMVEKGSVLVTQGDPEKPPAQLLAKIGEGEIFGEMSLVQNLPASANVMAEIDTQVVRLDVEDFYELIAEHPKLESHAYLAIAQILAHRLSHKPKT